MSCVVLRVAYIVLCFEKPLVEDNSSEECRREKEDTKAAKLFERPIEAQGELAVDRG